MLLLLSVTTPAPMLPNSCILFFDECVAKQHIHQSFVKSFDVFVKGTFIERRLVLFFESSSFRNR